MARREKHHRGGIRTTELCVRICSSTSREAPDDVLGYFVDLRNDLDAFFMYLSSFYGVELHRRDSLIIFDRGAAVPEGPRGHQAAGG